MNDSLDHWFSWCRDMRARLLTARGSGAGGHPPLKTIALDSSQSAYRSSRKFSTRRMIDGGNFVSETLLNRGKPVDMGQRDRNLKPVCDP